MSEPFPRVAIVGVGLIGGSLGMALIQRGLASDVVGVGRRRETLQRAVDLGAIHRYRTDFESGVLGADLVVLATPVPQILADLERIGPLLDPGSIVTDVGSIKAEIVQAGEAHITDAFVGSHPMAGSEKAGVDAARADLFENAVWVVTPTGRTPISKAERVTELAAAVGSRTLYLDPKAHDRGVAVTSHLPHLLAFALASLAGQRATQQPRLFDLAAGSFASGTRVAASNPELWQGICLGNRDALLEALNEYRRELDVMAQALAAGDSAALLESLERGYAVKENLSPGRNSVSSDPLP